jgi:hypothetical protein
MRLLIIILYFLFCWMQNIHAQELPDDKRDEKIQSLEIAFISRKLNLKPEEAQKFWPVFNEYRRDIRQMGISHKQQPDHDVLEFEQKLIDIRKKYKDQFSGAIGKQRVNEFFKAEHEFRGVLLNRIKNHPPKNERFPNNREKRFRN